MGSAWLQVLDRPLSYNAAYKGMLINGINNVLLWDRSDNKIICQRADYFSACIIEEQARQTLMCEILPVYRLFIFPWLWL